MNRILILTLTVVIVLMSSFNQPAYGYSYGDPNEELVAEAYKEMVVKLNESPPNYKSARAIFDTVKEEIDMHMGKEPGAAIIHHIVNEDTEAILSDMEKILVLNISRRLENVEKSFQEYDTSKKLLAKAFATYKALTTVVEEKNSDANKLIEANFESTLEALGNPGLFGVGEKESNIEQFKTSKADILTTLKDVFKMGSVEVGHFTEEDFEMTEPIKNEGWTDKSNLKNWIPIVILVGAFVAIIIYVQMKKKK